MRSALREDLGGFLIGLYQQRLFCVTPRGASLGPDFLTPLAREDSRHAISGEIARGRFGGGVAWAGPPVEGCQPEPRASIVGRGSRRNGLRGGYEDWGHGPSDAPRLGSPLQRLGSRRASHDGTEGPKPRLSSAQMAEVARIVGAGPDREKDGVVRWRRVDLKRVIAERFGVGFHPRYVGKLLKELGFSHISARPRHPAQDERIVEAFKKLPARTESSSRRVARDDAGRNLVPDAMRQDTARADWQHWQRSQ